MRNPLLKLRWKMAAAALTVLTLPSSNHTVKAQENAARIQQWDFAAALEKDLEKASLGIAHSTTPERRLNAEFERAALAVIERNGDQFYYLNLMPYEVPVHIIASIMGPGFMGGKQEQALTAQVPDLFAEWFGPELYDELQLFVAAHEFKHYLNFKSNKYQPMGADITTPLNQQRIRLNELSGDVYGLHAVRAIHPQKATEFARRLQHLRLAVYLSLGDISHQDIVSYKLAGLEKTKPNQSYDPLLLSNKTDAMMDAVSIKLAYQGKLQVDPSLPPRVPPSDLIYRWQNAHHQLAPSHTLTFK